MAEKSKNAKAPKISPQANTVKLAKTASANIAVVTRKTKSTKEIKQDEQPQAKPLAVRAQLIAEKAYFLSAERGFAPGHEVSDWLEAEQAIDELYQFT
jgi:hypothetical protein